MAHRRHSICDAGLGGCLPPRKRTHLDCTLSQQEAHGLRTAVRAADTSGVTPRNGQNRTLSPVAKTEPAWKTGFTASPGEGAWPKARDFGHASDRARIA